MSTNVISYEYDNLLHNTHNVYSGVKGITEIQDYLGRITQHTLHTAPEVVNRIWKFEPADLPILEWEMESIYNKLKELNNHES